MKLTRREFVQGAVAVAALQAVRANAGENKNKNKGHYQRISCEEHVLTPEILTELGRLPKDVLGVWAQAVKPTPLTGKLLDMGEGRIKEMDENGVDMQILSLTAPGVQLFDPPIALSLAKVVNDRMAAAIKKYPTRFAGLAVIAPQDPAGTAKELERAVKNLGFKGGIINSHTNGEYLDDKKYWPILEAAQALDVPIYIHPREPAPSLAGIVKIPRYSGAWGFGVEAGTHALRLIGAGVFDQFPKLRIVLGHLGEMLPFLQPRIDQIEINLSNVLGQKGPKRRLLREYLRDNFFVTSSGMNYSAQVIATLEVMGPDKVLFAADYPYEIQRDSVQGMETAKISAEQKRKIFEENPKRVFGL